MTTPPGQDPQPGPTRGGPARPAPRRGDPRARGDAPPARPARPESDPWPADRGGTAQGWGGRRGAGRDRASRGGAGPGWDSQREAGRDRADRDRPGQGWGGQDGRGTGGRAPRERSSGERASGWDNDRRPAGTGRGYPGANAEARGGDGGGARADGWGPGDRAAALAGMRRGPLVRWVGTLPTHVALYIVLGAALLGVVGTLMTGGEPGFLLGFLIIVGCVAAAIGIQRRGLYLLIPVPALTFFLTAVLTGAVHDSGIDTSKAELGVNFLQWIADVFFGMCAATILVLVIGGGRWLLSRQLVSGQFPTSAVGVRSGRPGGSGGPGGPGARPGSRSDGNRRPAPDRDPWDDGRQPFDRDRPRGSAATPDPRDAPDPWGDRRPADGRGQQGDPDPWNDRRPGGRTPPQKRNPQGPPGGDTRDDPARRENRAPWLGNRGYRDRRGDPPRSTV